MVGVNVPLPVPVAYHSFGGRLAITRDLRTRGCAFLHTPQNRDRALASRHPQGRGVQVSEFEAALENIGARAISAARLITYAKAFPLIPAVWLYFEACSANRCLQGSERSAVCCVRHSRSLPLPCSTLAQNF
jgi:hypothetical protein